MADIRINQLPEEMSPVASEVIAIDGATTRKATIQAIVYAGRPAASQAEAEAGSDANKAMTPLTTKQAITAQVSTAGRTGDYNDLSNKPTLGSAAAQDTTAFATAAQGATADSALQPAAIGTTVQAYSANLDSFSATTPAAFATAAQGALADTALQTVTDADLAAPANITYLNQTETTLDFYGGDLVEMFTVSTARKFSIGAANINFAEAFTVPAGAQLNVEDGAIFIPTFEPIGVARETPLITLGAGVSANYLKLQLDAGINTIQRGIHLSDNCQVGYIECTSADLNNNRTGTENLAGAVIINGDHIRVGQMLVNRFDSGATIFDSSDVVIGKVRQQEIVRGIFGYGSRDIHILSGNSTGPTDPTEPNSFNRGTMTPGAKSLVLAGVSDSSFSNWYSYDILEHAIRVGQILSGTTVPNQRLSFSNIRSYRSYGCGFKCDDADDFLIKDISLYGFYGEDIGRGNWFGTVGYSDWSSGSNNTAINNDGNKVACAIRNTQRAIIVGVQSKINAQTESGYIGFWLERSTEITAVGIDTQNARTTGIAIQTGGTTATERVYLRGRTSSNLGSGVKLDASSSNAAWRANDIEVNSQANGTGGSGYDFEVTANLSGGSPYATYATRLGGFARGGASGPVSIAAPVAADADFKMEVTLPDGRATYDPANLADGSGVTTTVTLTGATVGDFAEATFSNDLQGITLTAWVSAANTVSVRFQNETGGAIDLASGTLKVRVKK